MKEEKKTNVVREWLKPFNESQIGQVKVSIVLDPRKCNLKELRRMEGIEEQDVKVLLKDKTLPKIPIAVRVMEHGISKYFRTGQSVTFVEFYQMKSASGNSTLARIKKDALIVYDKVVKQLRELQSDDRYTYTKLRENVTGKTPISFFELWQNIINEKKDTTAENYGYALKSFRKYTGADVKFHELTSDRLNGWKDWLRKIGKSETTCSIYMRAIKVPIREAIKQGYIKPINNPLNDVKMPKSRKRTTNCIDIATINKLRSYRGNESWEEAVAIWVFSYLAGGANIADIVELRYDDYYYQTEGKDLKFTRKKTEDSTQEQVEILIPISGEIKAIMDKYGSKPMRGVRVFPQLLGYDYDNAKEATMMRIKQANQNIRKRMHRVCKALDLPMKVSPTWARHSFKTNAVQKGIDNIYVEMAMGHTLSGVQGNYMGQWSWDDRSHFIDILLDEGKSKPKMDDIKAYIMSLSVEERKALIGL